MPIMITNPRKRRSLKLYWDIMNLLCYLLCIGYCLNRETPFTNQFFDAQTDNVLFLFCHSSFQGKRAFQNLTVHTNYGNAQSFPVNNP